MAPMALAKAPCLASRAKPSDTSLCPSAVEGNRITLGIATITQPQTLWTTLCTVVLGMSNALDTTRYDAPVDRAIHSF